MVVSDKACCTPTEPSYLYALYFVLILEFFSFSLVWKCDPKITVEMQYSCNSEDQKSKTSMFPMNAYFRMGGKKAGSEVLLHCARLRKLKKKKVKRLQTLHFKKTKHRQGKQKNFISYLQNYSSTLFSLPFPSAFFLPFPYLKSSCFIIPLIYGSNI